MFVKVAIKEKLAEIDIKQETTVIIESDNSTSQYKSCAHFFNMQELADEMKLRKIRVFDIPEHFFFNWDSLHARLNSHYEAWSYKKKKYEKIRAHRKSV